ncbi:formate/nitrite transporter family protein [Sneathiella litorea]|uniref:Formate transporter FocA n=1 Tax=Sneathiella litorea TaxID=2606216 RepID=A0A6L8W4U6_9PROT|nr:formate/nitrite transporter family protein [Sneathiella litorea]MZR29513.1 formate transporter FocA [Sneathiella litorea]
MANNHTDLGIDAYSPKEIATRVETTGIAKAQLGFRQTLMLAILAGAFIALGAAFYTLVVTGSDLGFGPTRFTGGIAFSLGLILVIVGGAELFTGNNLIVMAWASRKVTHRQLLRNWIIVYVGNFIGAIGTAVLVSLSGILSMNDGGVAATAISIASTKLSLPWQEAFFRAVLCNTLVCLAVWLCFAAHSVSGKILAIIFPIAAFVSLGFEHSVANMYLIPIAYFEGVEAITVSGFLINLFIVTAGNILGGSVLVALVYWLIYLRKSP